MFAPIKTLNSMKKTIVAFSLLTVLFVSCKKDNENKQVTATKENLTGTYVMTAATISSSGQTVNVFNNADANMNLYEACDRDDLYKLNADLSFQQVDAGTSCSPDNNYTSTWEFVNATTIKIDGETGTITSWDGKTLVTTADFGGATYTTTMVKQ